MSSVSLRDYPVQAKPYVGVWVTKPNLNILRTAHRALELNFEFIAASIVGPNGEFCWTGQELTHADWNPLIVGVLSNPELSQTDESNIPEKAQEFLIQQVEHCIRLNIARCLLRFSDFSAGDNTINTIYSKWLEGANLCVWIDIPVYGKLIRLSKPNQFEQACESKDDNPWKFWKKIQSWTNYHQNLYLALRLPDELRYESVHLQRWLTEPVKCLIINIKHFKRVTLDTKECAHLHGIHEDLVRRFLENGANILLESDGASRPETFQVYHHAIEHLKRQIAKELQEKCKSQVRAYWSTGYENILMDPLQPLMFDLPTETYESFERDPVKYVLYERAIYKAILKLMTHQHRVNSSSEKMIIVVAGAGRGPIVESALRAAKKANALNSIDLIALEKNQTAVNVLRKLEETSWNGKAKVVCADMRTWDPPMGKVDLIVSELLGSFGDNELSPECLDGAQKYLKPNGIIIPQSYSSFVQPIMSEQVYRTLRNPSGVAEEAAKERAYVVYFKNSVRFAPPQRLFSFEHPTKLNGERTNKRYSRLEFPVTKEGFLHGFAGYFETTLYDDVKLSITPADHTNNMISWWPFYLPIRMQIPLNFGDLLVAHFFRKMDMSRVWYEWTVTDPISLPLHNANGRHYSMGY